MIKFPQQTNPNNQYLSQNTTDNSNWNNLRFISNPINSYSNSHNNNHSNNGIITNKLESGMIFMADNMLKIRNNNNKINISIKVISINLKTKFSNKELMILVRAI